MDTFYLDILRRVAKALHDETGDSYRVVQHLVNLSRQFEDTGEGVLEVLRGGQWVEVPADTIMDYV